MTVQINGREIRPGEMIYPHWKACRCYVCGRPLADGRESCLQSIHGEKLRRHLTNADVLPEVLKVYGIDV